MEANMYRDKLTPEEVRVFRESKFRMFMTRTVPLTAGAVFVVRGLTRAGYMLQTNLRRNQILFGVVGFMFSNFNANMAIDARIRREVPDGFLSRLAQEVASLSKDDEQLYFKTAVETRNFDLPSVVLGKDGQEPDLNTRPDTTAPPSRLPKMPLPPDDVPKTNSRTSDQKPFSYADEYDKWTKKKGHGKGQAGDTNIPSSYGSEDSGNSAPSSPLTRDAPYTSNDSYIAPSSDAYRPPLLSSEDTFKPTSSKDDSYTPGLARETSRKIRKNKYGDEFE